MTVLLYHYYNKSLRNVTFIFCGDWAETRDTPARVHLGSVYIYNIIYYSRMNKFKRRRELC